MHPVLQVKDLNVNLNGNQILSHITFDLNRGETLAIIGPNGAGKTVLLKSLLNLLPYQGQIEWGPDIRFGYVPQKLNIPADLPLTTREFFSLKGAGKEKVSRVLSLVGFHEDKPHVGHLKKHVLEGQIGNLSGGELQKVLIAWALVDKPDVLLFDEPTAGVDITSEETIYELLKRLQDEQKLAIILVSHDLNVVYKFAGKVVCLNKELVCYGPPLDVLDKANLQKLFGAHTGIYQHQHSHS